MNHDHQSSELEDVSEQRLLSGDFRLSFDAQLENAFRASQDARYHIPRVIFFAFCSLSWLVGAFLNEIFFQVREGYAGLVLLIELAWAMPVLAAASLMPLITRDIRWIYPFNVAGTLSLWGGVLSMHVLAQFGVLDYPIHMLSISVMAVAFFGGFRFRPMLFGSAITMSLGMLAVWLGERSFYPLGMYLYETFYFWVIAVFGLLAIEMLNRTGFIFRRRIQSLARVDGLTGLLNRRTFDQEYERLVRQAARESSTLCVAMIDLDHFKRLNDQYGHALGDEALRQTGKALNSTLCGARPLDLKARYGGEEFVVVWFAPANNAAAVMGQRLTDAIRNIELETAQYESVPLTASVGICCTVAANPTQGAAILQRADQALYQAKNSGRNQFVTDTA